MICVVEYLWYLGLAEVGEQAILALASFSKTPLSGNSEEILIEY